MWHAKNLFARCRDIMLVLSLFGIWEAVVKRVGISLFIFKFSYYFGTYQVSLTLQWGIDTELVVFWNLLLFCPSIAKHVIKYLYQPISRNTSIDTCLRIYFNVSLDIDVAFRISNRFSVSPKYLWLVILWWNLGRFLPKFGIVNKIVPEQQNT